MGMEKCIIHGARQNEVQIHATASILRGTKGGEMHTDEYEISTGREISLCRNMIKKLKKSLEKREKQYGMTTAALLQAMELGRRCADLSIYVFPLCQEKSFFLDFLISSGVLAQVFGGQVPPT